MWAQLIKIRLQPGKADRIPYFFEQLRAAEQPDSGLIRETAMLDQADPDSMVVLVVFESEEKARAREQDPRRQAGQEAIRAAMADMIEGQPEFLDLTVVEEMSL